LTGFDGTAVTKVNFFPREAGSSFTLRIWQGANAANLVYEQPLSGLTFDAWNEVTLNTPAPIDPEQELWIGFYVLTGGYPAGCGTTTGAANGDYITLDGILWEHLSDYALNYTWNLAAYVEGAKGQIQLPAITDNATYNNNNSTGLAAGNLPVIEDQVAPNAPSEFLSYNVYRDGELIATDVMENTYVDEVGVPGLVCYTVTAVYEFCGESAHSNEACVDLGVGINELENSIAVYPNPATDFVMVESTQDIRSIEITNYMGQVVNSVKAVENTQYRINTSELSAGVYFVEVETAAGIEKVRVVISE
jgi:NADH/NAD ratio-sensing transcriptional regulator Rex